VSGSLVTPETRARVREVMTPVAVGLGKLGLTPNALTLIGFGVAIVAAGAAAAQAWLVAGLLVAIGGVFDLFDGALARATGKASKLGAFMDSVFDRWSEGVVYVGIVAGSLAGGFDAGAVLAAAAMASAFMVSYTRAKSESLGFSPGTGMAAVGLAPREVRIVILTIGLILTGLMGGVLLDDGGQMVLLDAWGFGRWPLAISLGLIAVLATATTLQRIVHTIRQSQHQQR
jgi:CDP-diacylglycerol--glycerol-3-phosphate 3-phosphatidyltransferase